MLRKLALAALFVMQMFAAIAFAQSAMPDATATGAEYGRVSGGQIDLITKHSQTLSGSLGISMSKSQLPFASPGHRYDATLGGTLLADRLWFFASAEQNDSLFGSRFVPATAISDRAVSRGIDSKMTAQIGDRQSLAASFSAAQAPMNVAAPNPSSFLSLRYTGIVSDHMFFNMNISRSSVRQPALPFVVQQ